MEGSQADREVEDRAALLRRIGWERAGFRGVRLVLALVLVVGGAMSLLGAEDSRADGIFPFGLGVVLLWDLWRGDREEKGASPLSREQFEALRSTLHRDGRLAAVKQLREWTGATYSEATRDIDAAFPERAQGPPG